jgi:hypothetical protein
MAVPLSSDEFPRGSLVKQTMIHAISLLSELNHLLVQIRNAFDDTLLCPVVGYLDDCTPLIERRIA